MKLRVTVTETTVDGDPHGPLPCSRTERQPMTKFRQESKRGASEKDAAEQPGEEKDLSPAREGRVAQGQASVHSQELCEQVGEVSGGRRRREPFPAGTAQSPQQTRARDQNKYVSGKPKAKRASDPGSLPK